MSRASMRTRKEAQRLFLSGEMETNAEIAAHLKVKPHTIGRWRKEDGWDDIKRKAAKNLAEDYARSFATENISTNMNHLKVWDVILAGLAKTLRDPDPNVVRILDRQASILERAQKGQRLGRGLSIDGQTEEKIRAEAQAEIRRIIDLFIDTVKECVSDEETRDRIGQRLLSSLPRQEGTGTSDEDEPSAH